MAQKSNLYRRGSGVYVVRMVVPLRLREVVGKCEVHTTTGTREPAVAKAVAAGVNQGEVRTEGRKGDAMTAGSGDGEP